MANRMPFSTLFLLPTTVDPAVDPTPRPILSIAGGPAGLGLPLRKRYPERRSVPFRTAQAGTPFRNVPNGPWLPFRAAQVPKCLPPIFHCALVLAGPATAHACGNHGSIFPTFRPVSRHQFVNILSIFRHETANIQHQHLGKKNQSRGSKL